VCLHFSFVVEHMVKAHVDPLLQPVSDSTGVAWNPRVVEFSRKGDELVCEYESLIVYITLGISNSENVHISR